MKSYTIGDDVLSQSVHTTIVDPQLPTGSITYQQDSYFLYDGHGSTRQLANAQGSVTAQYAYDAYGVMLGQTSGAQQRQATSLLYSGEQFDSTLQQYHLRARNYNQANGQFTTLDPYSGNLHDPHSLHKYAYCHTDPVNAVDPSGEYSDYSLSGMTMAASITAAIISGLGQYNYSRNVLHASAWDSICSSLVSAAMAFFAVYYAPLIFAELMASSLVALAFVSMGMGGLLMEGAELLGQAWSDQYTPMQKVAIGGKLLSIILTGCLAGISVRYGGNPSFGVTIKSPQGTATVVGDGVATETFRVLTKSPSDRQFYLDYLVDEYFSSIRFRAKPTYEPLMEKEFAQSFWLDEAGNRVPYNTIGPRSFLNRHEVMDSLIHEEIHLRYPKLTEKEVIDLAELYLKMRGL